MLLKRLSSSLPAYLVDYIATLAHLDVKITDHLLYTPSSHLSKLGIPPADLDDLIAHVLLLTGPAVIPGDEALGREEQDDKSWPGWGRSRLDETVEWDGIGILEISGGKRVGKSLLALHAVLRLLVEDEMASCRWIDTEGGFSPTRATKILEEMGQENIEQVLNRLVVVPCFQVEPDLFDILGDIRNCFEGAQGQSPAGETQDGGNNRLRAIVIDPVSTLFKDTLSATTAQGHAAMVTVMEEIAELTYTHRLLTIVTSATASSLPTNPLSSFSATTVKPTLGATFTYHSDISLLVQETGKVFGLVDEQERERTRKLPGLRALVEVLKSRVGPAGRWTVFETNGTSLMDVIPSPTEDERATLGVNTRPLYGPLSETMLE